MNIASIDAHLRAVRNQALSDLGVPDEAIADLNFEEPPNPEMGDVGLPCFALARHLKKAPPLIAEEVAEAMREHLEQTDGDGSDGVGLIAAIEPTGPYVNIRFDEGKLAEIVVTDALAEDFGAGSVEDPQHWMIEYSAPNTNKPQHLGHVRNDLLGESVATICEYGGHDMVRVNLINDRGIHICKSMVAYLYKGGPDAGAPNQGGFTVALNKWANARDQWDTPEATGQKGDHFVGEYYVTFNEMLQSEYEDWQDSGEANAEFQAWLAEEREAGRVPDDLGDQRNQVRQAFFKAYEDKYFNKHSILGAEARQMLREWEKNDPAVRALWSKMNAWVLDGFEATYERLGVEFDKVYYESNTYELGRQVVEEGLEAGIFERLDDGAVAFDLEKVGMDGQKILMRSDGTTVYMTQDLGTALERFDDYDLDRLIYVVGDEQDYHFEVLFKILAQVRSQLEGRMQHLSYGMVDLPEGKMKSREGKVVDADDLMDEMAGLAEEAVRTRWEELSDTEIARRAEEIGMAALKYYILDFNPRTNVQFDPEKSIDFQGRTGPYCLYGYARVQSIGKRLGGWPDFSDAERTAALQALGTDREMDVVRRLRNWPDVLRSAVGHLDPSAVTEYLFKLVKSFSSLYNDPDHRIVDLEGPRRDGLIVLSRAVANTIALALDLLGIDTLEEM